MAEGRQQCGEGIVRRALDRKEAMRRRILEAAAQVFAEKGYHDSAVEDIVKASNTSKGSVYFHFPNKQSIFLVLVDYLAGRLIDRVESAIAGERGGIARVDAALRTVIEGFSTHRGLAKILLVEVVGLGHGFDQKLVDVRARFANLIKAYLDRAVAEGDIPPQDTELAAYVWLGAINEVLVRWLYTGQPDPLEAALPTLRCLLLRSVGYAPALGIDEAAMSNISTLRSSRRREPDSDV